MAGNGLSERLQTPISTAELERRWNAVRAAMKREKVDVLLMQNNNDHMGGYVKYFTDMPATNGYPNTVIFPADDEMTVVCQGPFKGDGRPPGMTPKAPLPLTNRRICRGGWLIPPLDTATMASRINGTQASKVRTRRISSRVTNLGVIRRFSRRSEG